MTTSSSTVLTVITPLGPGAHPHLVHAGQSIIDAKNVIPESTVNWVLAGGNGVDWDQVSRDLGVGPVAPGTPSRDGAITLVNVSGNCAAGVARNMAAMSASPDDWLVNLDADDMMLPNRLKLVRDVAESGEYDYLLTAADDLTPDGTDSWKRFSPDVQAPNKVLHPGWFDQSITNGGGKLDVLAGTLALPAHLLIELGGYPGLPYMEDTVLMQRLSKRAELTGRVTDEIAYLYRKKVSGQMTSWGYDTASIMKTWAPSPMHN